MKGLILATILALSGCATVPTFDGTNQAEIDKAKAFNKKVYWTTITLIAIAPYTIDGSSGNHHDDYCQSSKSCRN